MFGEGAEVSGGFAIQLDDPQGDVGAFASSGIGGGINVSGDLFAGLVKGDVCDLESPTTNVNIVAFGWSLTVLTDSDSGDPLGFTLGYGPGLNFGLSITTTSTSVTVFPQAGGFGFDFP